MSLSIQEIKNILREHDLLKSINQVSNHNFDYVSYDSRDIKPNTLFFGKGNFKPEFVTKAKDAGATGIVCEKHLSESNGMNEILVTNIQKAMSLISAAFFNYPQDDLFIIAFTGTKGKTTSSYFTRDAIEKATGDRTALFSTINTVVGNKPDQTFKSHLTTPESLDVFKNMRAAVDNGMKYLIMEVSSQAYLKNRVYGLKYNVGNFLNISPDHIGENEHPTFANYLHCKEQLLVNSHTCILNADSDHLVDIYYAAKTTTDPENIYLFGKKGTTPQIEVDLDFVYESISDSLTDNDIQLNSVSEKAKKLGLDGNYRIGIPGDYNESNATASIISAGLAGFKRGDMIDGLASARIPGRMEIFKSKNHGNVHVDYAHNYASMNALLGFLKCQDPNGKVIVVVGSPGNKGIDRRKGFGKALTQNADVAFLTTDDPAYEDPMKIAKEIDNHIDHDKVDVHFEMDREKAIKDAINFGKTGDIIVVAGKGRDPYQKINGVDTPYPTDSVIVEDYLEDLNSNDK